MRIRPAIFVIVPLLSLFSAAIASAQSFQTGVTYVCGGERLLIESCNMQNQSDNSSCLVQHPDRPLHNGFVAYTNETRGTLKKLIPTCKQPSADEIARVQAFQKKQQATQDAAQAKAIAQMDTPPSAPGGPGSTTASTTGSGDAKLIRCVESGRSETQCASTGLLDPVMGMVNALLPGAAAETNRSGLAVIGTYKSQGLALSFSGTSLQVAGCADLAPDSIDYSVVFKGNQALLNVKNLPQPFTLAFTADGKLVGPGLIDVKGSIVIGHENYWVTPAGTRSNPNPVGHSESVPIFQPKTARCSIGTLTSTGPITPDTGDFLGAFSQIMSLGSTPAAAPAPKKLLPGFRMEGTYSGAGGLSIEFATQWAVLNCGQSGDTVDYSVESNAAQTLVRIQDGATPIVLTARPDGTLVGSGSLPVNGRRLTGKDANDNLTFAPRPATCALGVLSPGGSATTSTSTGTAAALTPASATPVPPPAKSPASAAPASAPSPSAPGNAVLAIVSGISSAPGAVNSLAGHTLVLLKDSFETVLTKGGFAVPSGVMPFTAMLAACKNQQANCQTAVAALNAETVAGVKIDATGKATFAGVKPGTYYVMGSGAAPAASAAAAKLLMWNVRVDLEAGTNSIIIDQRNATPVK